MPSGYIRILALTSHCERVGERSRRRFSTETDRKVGRELERIEDRSGNGSVAEVSTFNAGSEITREPSIVLSSIEYVNFASRSFVTYEEIHAENSPFGVATRAAIFPKTTGALILEYDPAPRSHATNVAPEGRPSSKLPPRFLSTVAAMESPHIVT